MKTHVTLAGRTAKPVLSSRAMRILRGAFGFALLFGGAALAQEFQASEFTPCQNPCSSIVLSGGNQLVAEGGAQSNHALLLFVDQRGDQLNLPSVAGLPAGRTRNRSTFGPLAFALDGDTMYIAVGESDQFHTTGPAFIRAMATVFSPDVIRIRFPGDPSNSGPFVLDAATRQQLLNGQPVVLTDFSGRTATFDLVARLGTNAHPVALALLPAVPNRLFVVDSRTRRLNGIDLTTGQVSVVAQFPTTVESMRAFGDRQLLVTFYSSQANGSSVWLIDPVAGQSRLIIDNLTSAIDLIARNNGGATTFFVLEANAAADGTGQVLSIDSTGTRRTVLANELNDPTSLAIDEFTGRLFIHSRGDGLIYTVPLP